LEFHLHLNLHLHLKFHLHLYLHHHLELHLHLHLRLNLRLNLLIHPQGNPLTSHLIPLPLLLRIQAVFHHLRVRSSRFLFPTVMSMLDF
jgi:hypothetical protein